jgi:hypothetical protein
MTVYNVYDQLADLIAKLNPNQVQALKATPDMQVRLESLIEKSKNNELDKREKDELDHFIVLERLIRLAKLRSLSNT